MPEITIIWKLAGLVLMIVTGGLGWFVGDLKDKHKRAVIRTDQLFEKIGDHRERLTKLESDTITEAQVISMLSEMERRIMNNFKDFRLEFKDDLSSFRSDLREDLKEIKQYKD